MPLIDVYNIAVLAILVVLTGISIYNVWRFATLPQADSAPDEAVRVSVLVPARNEERCIEACVRSLCLQTWPNLEVIVLDDNSTDATGSILHALEAEFPALRVMKGAPLPDGWVGKSWACHQLSEQASGSVLLFTDADTEHRPDTVARALRFMGQHSTDLLSLVPYQILGSFAEHVVIPMVHVLYFSYLPNNLILSNPRVSLSAANGQFMCFRRAAYEKIRGHRVVQSSLVEDVFLARAVKASGGRIALVNGTNAVRCRMYTSAADVTRGFSKNFFPATGYNLPITLLFLLHLLTAFVVPLPMLVYAVFAPRADVAMFAGAQLLLAGIIRVLILRCFEMPFWHSILQPLSAAWACVIGVNSIRWAYSKAGTHWKGRSYSTSGSHHA